MISAAINQTGNEPLPDTPTQGSVYNSLRICAILVNVLSIFLNGSTILFIVCSTRLRKQHNIFTVNMTLINLFSASFGIWAVESTNDSISFTVVISISSIILFTQKILHEATMFTKLWKRILIAPMESFRYFVFISSAFFNRNAARHL